MKKLFFFICTFLITNLSAQHVIELINTTSEDVEVELFAVLDVCGGASTTTSIIVPAGSTVFTGTTATPPVLDEVLLHAGVTTSGGIPVTFNFPGFTTSTVYNISSSPSCIMPVTGFYTSAIPPFTTYSISWTSGALSPPGVTSNGNPTQHDVIRFF